MLTIRGNILACIDKPGTQVIIHGCNTMGKFGFGVAGALTKEYPSIRLDYLHTYNQRGLYLGDIIITRVEEDVYIVHAIVQDSYRGAVPREERETTVFSDALAIKECFFKVNRWIGFHLPDQRVTINFPKIGAGLANGNWDEIRDNINEVVYQDNVELVQWQL